MRRIVPQGEQEQYAEIVLDQDSLGIEWAMYHTIPQFMDRVVTAWQVEDLPDNGRVVVVYFTQCLSGRAVTHWKAVVDQHAKTDALKPYTKCQDCVQYYL